MTKNKEFNDYLEVITSQDICASSGFAAVKTSGAHLEFKGDTPVSTGKWKFAAPNDIDYLLIFHVQTDGPAKLWLGKVTTFEKVKGLKSKYNFYKFNISNAELIGVTTQQWKIFTNNGQASGVRYLQRKAVSPTSVIAEKMAMGIPPGNEYPKKICETRDVIERCEKVKEYALSRAKGQCQGCSNSVPPLLMDSGSVFLEVHHVRFLRDSGPDTVHNTVALCPRCHKKAHYSCDRQEFMEHLYEMNDFLVR
ncbi:HNH endonuclease [Cedecea lapagei]|uniref:HNH endonuclease n=1 Tax=Cedecea lapagei TaxID=158823 RepID=A0A3S4JBY1_9ENTR|nr:HNH endonuclease [Cedecea lapagei]VEB97985.1 HNH endonuclease [Cedecea lapagei]